MPDLELDLRRYAAAVIDGVEPVAPAAVVGRERPASRRRTLVVAGLAALAAVVVAVVAVVAWRRDEPQHVDAVGVAHDAEVSWVELFRLVPDTPDVRRGDVHVADAARARAEKGMTPPPPSAPTAQVDAEIDYLFRRALRTRWLITTAHAADVHRAELGIDAREADQAISWGVPPEEVTVARGSFDPDAIEAAVMDDPVWSPVLSHREVEGGRMWSWGDDFELTDRMSPLRGSGRSARLAVVGDVAVWAAGDPSLDEALGALDDRLPDLADDPHVRLLAEEADRRMLVTATLRTKEGVLASHVQPDGECHPDPCQAPHLDDRHLPEALLAGRDSGEPVVLFAYADAAAAAAAVEPVRALDEELRRLTRTGGEPPTITVEGRLLVLTGATGVGLVL